MTTGRSGKIGAIARLLEECQVPITSELAHRCHECDGDGALISVDAGNAGRRSRSCLAGTPLLERFDLLGRPPTPALCLQLLRGSIAHGAVVGRCGIVSGTASAFAVQPPFALKQGCDVGRDRLLCLSRRHHRERQRHGQGRYRGRDTPGISEAASLFARCTNCRFPQRRSYRTRQACFDQAASIGAARSPSVVYARLRANAPTRPTKDANGPGT